MSPKKWCDIQVIRSWSFEQLNIPSLVRFAETHDERVKAEIETFVMLFLKNLLFTIVVPGTVSVYIPLFVFSHVSAEVSVRAVAGAFLLFTGGSVYFWCLWDFASYGGGTPAPIDPPKRLVVRGLYRYTRNPMYLGVLLVIFGWSLLFHSLPLAVYGLCVAVCFHLVVVLYEEPHLRRVFGASYVQYCSQVSRWLSLHKHQAAG